MTTKRCNWKTDLQLSETFYELSSSNTLVKTAIPDETIDFQLVYRAEHDRRIAVGREGGVYRGCKRIDDNTLAVFLPLSRHSLGQGPLLRELYMKVPNNDFQDRIRNICVPADTKHFLWDGPTDNDVVVTSDIVIATILKGNTGDSAYQDAVQHGYEGTEAEYALWPIMQGNAAKGAAERAISASSSAEKAVESASLATKNARDASIAASNATNTAKTAAENARDQTEKASAATRLATEAAGKASDAIVAAKNATSDANTATSNANKAAQRAEKAAADLANASEVTQNAIDATNRALAATRIMQEMQPQIEKAASLVPTLLLVKYPAHITTANPREFRIDARLLPTSALQNVIFQVEEGTSIFVRPNGKIICRGVGTTRINVLPTSNIPLFQTIDIVVERPRVRMTGDGKIRRTAAGKIRLT